MGLLTKSFTHRFDNKFGMDLYYMDFSPPCRAVMLTGKALNITFNKIEVDLRKGEQKLKKFLDINPQHCIPTLVDGDLKLWESRAICTYLVSQYGKDDSLYPKNPKQRALVDKLLYFDMGSLTFRFADYMNPVLFEGQKAPNPAKLHQLHEALGLLNEYLTAGDFACGNNITVADHCLVATVSSFQAAGIDISEHKRVTSWLQRCEKSMPGYEAENLKGVKEFEHFVGKKFSE